MKKINYFIAVAAVFLASCSNNDEPILSENQQPETARVTYIRADANEDATTRGSVDGTTAAFTWNTGDKIAVYAGGYKISDDLASEYNATNAATFAFSGDNAVTESNRANFAIFPASLVWDGTSIRSGSASDYTATSLKLTLPASYTLAQVQDDVSPTPMIATNAPNGDLSFKALCPLLRVTVVNIPKQTKRIEFDFNGNKVQGEFALTGVTPGTTAIATSATDGTDDIITVTMADNTTWHDNLVINLPVPTGTYGNITITAYDATSDGHAVLTLTKPIKSTGWTPTRKSSRKMTATLPVFSVSDDKKVVFAPGNLVATVTAVTSGNPTAVSWAFHTNQYDRVYSSASTQTFAVDDKIDLFGWGTSGWDNGNKCYQPYNTSNADTGDYASSKGYGYGPTDGSTYTYSLTGTYANADWGVYNTSDLGSGWRTLTKDEWEYLFGTNSSNKRTTTSGILFAKAKVNDVCGVILLPDDWSSSYHSLSSPNTANAAFTTNSINLSEWTSDFEAHGCVFLPAAGYRFGTSVSGVDSYGNYWSSAANDSSSAYYLYFHSSSVNPADNSSRYTGRSVRLVRVAD